MRTSSIERYNRRIKQKRIVTSRFLVCPACQKDKSTDKSSCGKPKCPYDFETRGRPKNSSDSDI